MKSVRKVTRRSPQLDLSNREEMYYPSDVDVDAVPGCRCRRHPDRFPRTSVARATPPSVSTRTVIATLLRCVDEYANEDGNVSVKFRQRFRDTDEIRSRRRVIPAALPRHGEEGPREVV